MISLLEHDHDGEIPIEGIRREIYKAAERNGITLEEERFHEIVILALNVPMLRGLLRMTSAREIPWIYRMRPLYEGYVDGVPVNIIWAAPGAPLAAYVMEHLIAMGGRVFHRGWDCGKRCTRRYARCDTHGGHTRRGDVLPLPPAR